MYSLKHLEKTKLKYSTRKYKINKGAIIPFDISKEYQYNVKPYKNADIECQNSGWQLDRFCTFLSERNDRLFIEKAKQGEYLITFDGYQKIVDKASFDFFLNSKINKDFTAIENNGNLSQINFPRIIFFIYQLFKKLGISYENYFNVKDKLLALSQNKNEKISEKEYELILEILRLGVLNSHPRILFDYLFNFKTNYLNDTSNNKLFERFEYYISNYRLNDLVMQLFEFNKKPINLIDLCSGRGSFFESLIKNKDLNQNQINLIGVEINPFNVLVSKILGYSLDKEIRINPKNVLQLNFKGVFDYVFCDPPMGYEINPKFYSCKNKERNEILKNKNLPLVFYFIEKVLESLSNEGTGIIMVTGNALSNKKGTAYRKSLIKSKKIDAIIKIPKIKSTSQTDLHLMILKNNVQGIKFLSFDEDKYMNTDDYKKANNKIVSNYKDINKKRIDINEVISNDANLNPKFYNW